MNVFLNVNGEKMNETIVTKESFASQSFTAKTEKAVKQLEHAGLLPLKINNTNSFRLFVRILGLRYADGCIYYQKRNKSYTFALYFGDIKDASKVCNDVKNIWGIEIFPSRGMNCSVVYLPASISRLAISAGSPVGSKILQDFRLPKWVFILPEELKWEFIDGLFSGDGEAPRLKSIGTCSESLKLSLNSEKSVAEKFANGFMKDVSSLLRSLNIKSNEPKIMCNQKRVSKDGTISYPIGIRILTEKENMIRFLENVSYVYCNRTSIKIKDVLEGLKGEKIIENLKQILIKDNSNSKELAVLLEKNIQKKIIEDAANIFMKNEKTSSGKYKRLANFLHDSCSNLNYIKIRSLRDNYLPDWKNGKRFIPISHLKVLTRLCNLNMEDVKQNIEKVRYFKNRNKYAISVKL